MAEIQADLAAFGTAMMRVDADGATHHVALQSAFLPAEKRTRRERIRDKVLMQVRLAWHTELESSCWLWTGGDSGGGRGGGYPRMCLDGQTMAVHKVMWTNEHGIIPGKKQLDHKCRNRLCVNPEHLEMVTHRENQRRRAAARKDS